MPRHDKHRRTAGTDPEQRITPRRDDLSQLDKPAHPAPVDPQEAKRQSRHDAKTTGTGLNRRRPNPEGRQPGPTPGNALSPRR